jgi:hypothetical protein
MEALYFFAALALGAVLLIIIGKAKDEEAEFFRKNGIRTQATIMENVTCWGRIIVVIPVVLFTTENNVPIQAMDEHGHALAVPRFTVGQGVILVYEKSNPQNFRILSSGAFD